MGDTTTIRIKKELYDTVKSLAKEKNRNMQEIINEAIKDLKKKEFFDNLNSFYTKLKADPKAWAEEEAERAEWDATLLDGIDNDD
jgi:predicted transcriptional regulator